MLRDIAKNIAIKIPHIGRVFEQRDQALLEINFLKKAIFKQHEESTSKIEFLNRAISGWHEKNILYESRNKLEVQLIAAQGKLDEINLKTEHSKRVYSHWGEDSILEYLLSPTIIGRYLDIGCFHPALFSNTKKLHERGWSGVNVDPNPFMIDQFNLARPKDVNINMAVGKEKGQIEYFKFNDWGSSNTASPEFAKIIAQNNNLSVPVSMPVELTTLEHLMAENFPSSPPDFLNIDVEELDLDVLKSSDWGRHRPTIIAIEDINFSIDMPQNSEIYKFLKNCDYTMFSRCFYTNFFAENKFARKQGFT